EVVYEAPFELGDWDDFWSILDSIDFDAIDWDDIDWSFLEPDPSDPDFVDWDSLDWDEWDFDWDSAEESDYTQCEALQTGAKPAFLIKDGRPASRTLYPGTLSNDCEALPDLYGFHGEADTEVLIELVSDDFDAYLVLLDVDWNVPAADDDSTATRH